MNEEDIIKPADEFTIFVIGIIFDPIKKKILIGRKEKDRYLPNLTWHFPGDPLKKGEDIDKALKEIVKRKTGLTVKNIGTFFSKTYPENPNYFSVYFLTEAFEGEEKIGGDLVELKWVSPNEIESYFTTSFHRKLKEFLIDLV